MELPTEAELREMAKARVAFKQHAGIYVTVNLGLAVVWYVTSGIGSFYWPVFPHLGWGFGLMMQAFGIYGPGKEMEERELEKLRAKFGGAR